MRRILFRWHGLTVWSYPALLYVGLVVGLVAGNAAAHVAGIDARSAYVATLVLIPLALVGSRLLFVVTKWPAYRHNFRRIWDRDDGGAAAQPERPLLSLRDLVPCAISTKMVLL